MSLDLTSNNPQFIVNMDNRCEEKVYGFDEFRLDAEHLMVYRGSEEVSLPPKAVETLLVLVENRNEIVGKKELLETIWKEVTVEEQNLAQYVHLLRKALGARPDGKPFIETLKRRGYRFNGDVSVIENGSTIGPDLSNIGLFEKTEFASTAVAHAPDAGRVRRNGNVLALADWKRAENPSDISVEQFPSAYSDVYRTKPLGISYLYAAIAFVSLLVLTAPVLYWLRYSPFVRPSGNTQGDITYIRLTDGLEVDDAAISPDGKYFVYHEQDGATAHLWLQQTGQSNRVEIAPAAERKIFGKTFSPDGGFIYFIAQERPDKPNELFRVPTLGGVQEKILTDISAPVSFSPDGKEFAFLRWNGETGESSLMVADSDGGSEKMLSKRIWPEQFSGGVAWSPAGGQIAVGVTSRPPASIDPLCSLAAVDLQTGATAVLSEEKWDTCYRMAWTHDGQGLVFIGTKLGDGYSTRRDQVYYVSGAGGSHRITTDGSRHQPDSLSITNDDQLLVVPFNRASQIWAADPDGDSRSAQQLTTGLSDGRAGIAPLPDGRIAYISRTGENFGIWVMRSDGSGRRQLTGDPQIVEELHATPDGRYLVFSARQGDRSHLFRIDADGRNIEQLTDGNNHEIDSAISPDGKWIVYTTCGSDGDVKNVSLQKISIYGGDPVQIAHVDAEAPRFSPDGSFVSFATSDGKFGIIGSNVESPVKLFEPVQIPLLGAGAQWTTDGQALIYIVVQKNVGNLWLQPIDGTPARPLTDFTSGDIYNFAYSADHSRLYVARGYQIRDAVIVRNFR